MPKRSQLVEKVGQRATSLVFPHHPYQANQTPNPVLSFIRELVIAYWCSSPLVWQITFLKEKWFLLNTIYLLYHILDCSEVRALDTLWQYKTYYLKTLLLHYWNWKPPGQKLSLVCRFVTETAFVKSFRTAKSWFSSISSSKNKGKI